MKHCRVLHKLLRIYYIMSVSYIHIYLAMCCEHNRLTLFYWIESQRLFGCKQLRLFSHIPSQPNIRVRSSEQQYTFNNLTRTLCSFNIAHMSTHTIEAGFICRRRLAYPNQWLNWFKFQGIFAKILHYIIPANRVQNLRFCVLIVINWSLKIAKYIFW